MYVYAVVICHQLTILPVNFKTCPYSSGLQELQLWSATYYYYY